MYKDIRKGRAGRVTEERTDLERQLKDIQKWEKAQQRVMFWKTLTRLPFQLLDKLTPQFIQRKIGRILDETGTFIQSGGQYLTSEKRIIKSFRNGCRTAHVKRFSISGMHRLPSWMKSQKPWRAQA